MQQQDFLLELGQPPVNHVAQLSESFSRLPGSDYLDGHYRSKAHHRATNR
jgi:hypothetical protein